MIHAVKAIYDSLTFNPEVSIQTSEPIGYKCLECTFTGTLEQSVEHIVLNQFVVPDPPKRNVQ